VVKDNLQSRPIFAEHAALLFALGGKLVIVALKKRCLAVSDEKKAAHSGLKARTPRISRAQVPLRVKRSFQSSDVLRLFLLRLCRRIYRSGRDGSAAIGGADEAVVRVPNSKAQ
jgi:hypothetical protein